MALEEEQPEERMTARPDHFEIVFPELPPSYNEAKRWHWAKEKREREAWQELIWAYLNEKGHRCRRHAKKIELHATLFFPIRRGRDSDNYSMPLWKWTQDALVHNGVIDDDTADVVTAYPPKIAEGGPLTVIEITFVE